MEHASLNSEKLIEDLQILEMKTNQIISSLIDIIQNQSI